MHLETKFDSRPVGSKCLLKVAIPGTCVWSAYCWHLHNCKRDACVLFLWITNNLFLWNTLAQIWLKTLVLLQCYNNFMSSDVSIVATEFSYWKKWNLETIAEEFWCCKLKYKFQWLCWYCWNWCVLPKFIWYAILSLPKTFLASIVCHHWAWRGTKKSMMLCWYFRKKRKS
jgi:hypothetical protein